MFRFTIRDLFWLTLLVVVVCVNWITYRAAMNYKAERDAALKAWGMRRPMRQTP